MYNLNLFGDLKSEYAAAVWLPGLTVELTEALESIQARAMRLSFPDLDLLMPSNSVKPNS